MSSIIIDKLKQIEAASKNEKHHLESSTDVSTSNKNNASGMILTDKTLVNEQVSNLTKTDSDCRTEYHTAKVWAGKLRTLSRKQRLYAEKAIYDILFEAQLGNLDKSSVKINENKCCSSQSNDNCKLRQNGSARSSVRDNHSRCAHAAIRNMENEHPSSEIIISESFPIEAGTVSSECQVKVDNVSIVNPYNASKCSEHGRNHTFIVTTSPLSLGKTSTNSLSVTCAPETNLCKENCIEVDTFSMNAATNTPDCLLAQFNTSKLP